MPSTGAVTAKKWVPAVKSPSHEVITIEISGGKASERYVEADNGQRITFLNRDNENYRLRLRHGRTGDRVPLCVSLPSGQAAEFIADPDVCEKHPTAGHKALVEILRSHEETHLSSSAITKALSGTGPKGGGGGPHLELYILNPPPPDRKSVV